MRKSSITQNLLSSEGPIKPRNSLTFHTILSMGLRITLVVVLVSLVSYWHITKTLEAQTKDKLVHYIKERGAKESFLFQLAQDNHQVFKQYMLTMLEKVEDVPAAQFNLLFKQHSDDTLRMDPEFFSGFYDENGIFTEYHSAFIGPEAPIDDPLFRQSLVKGHYMLRRFGPAWTNKFANLYITYPDNAVVVYWPDYAWGADADKSLKVSENEWGYVANKINNPERKSVWTGLYYDQVAQMWMVSAETPIDFNGRHLMTVGHDLLLNDLFERVVNDHLEGSYNFIFRPDGRLIAHPEKLTELKRARGEMLIQDTSDARLKHYYETVLKETEGSEEEIKVFFDKTTDEFLAVAKINGPDWWFVTVFPRDLLSSAAQKTAQFVLLLGVLSLVLELLMLYLVLRYKVIRPLASFAAASTRVKKGEYAQVANGELEQGELALPVERLDEVGSLARMLRSMAGTIDENIEALKHMDRLKDDFMANTSHELRTPLNGIVGIAESMIDGASGELTESQRHNLLLIVSSGQRLAHLVDDILDFSKLKHHELDLKRQPVDIYALTEEVLLFTRHLLKTSKVRLLNQVNNNLPLAYADENRVQQILYNLIGNAIKFTHEGMISVSARAWRDHLTISVSDTGIGIEEEKQERIFESFEQADGSSAREYGGTGLGLAVTKRLVELHQGTIKVVSCPGKGSEFSFTLPICTEHQLDTKESESAVSVEAVRANPVTASEVKQIEAEMQVESTTLASHEVPAIPDEEVPTSLGRVLVVDDEAINIQVLCNHLTVSHYNVTSVSSGQEALNVINNHQPFDAILLDVMMPNMTGYEVCRRVRQLYPANQLPILMVTAKRGVDEMTACFEAGANDYLSKPVSKSELLQRLKTHIGIVKLNQELSEVNSQLKAHAQDLEQKVKLKAQKLARNDDKLKETSQKLQDANLKVSQSTVDIRTLEELGRGLTATLELNQVIKNIYRSLNKVLDAYSFLLGILDMNEQVIHVPLIVEDGQKLSSIDYSLSEKNCPAVICVSEQKEILILEKSDREAFFSASNTKSIRGEDLQTIIYLPLVIGGKVVGCMSVQHPNEFAFSEEQIDMLRTLAGYSAIAIANANGYAKLEQAHQALKETQKQMVLQEKMASLGTLTAGVAHEINNPTNFVHVGAQNLQSDLNRFREFIMDLAGDDADEEVLQTLAEQFDPLDDHINTMINGTQRIKTIVQDLRSFTHLHSTDKKPADIVDCLVSTISLVKTQYQDVTEFITDFKPLPKLLCYPAQLNQVFMNIIVNACDAISEKQTQLDSSFKGKITIHCEFTEGEIIVDIGDNGCGMSEQTRLKLYEPFYTTKPVGVGTGLGMAISFGIIEDHGGTILATSVEGEGSTITVKLPLA